MALPFDRIVHGIVRVLRWIAATGLVIMMGIITCNVVLRAFQLPILGASEIATYCLVVVACFGIVDAVFGHRNITVDFVTSKLRKKTQTVIGFLVCLLSIGIFGIMGWQGCIIAWEKSLKGEYDPILGFPLAPLRWLVAIGLIIPCVVLLKDLIGSVREVKE